MLEFRVFISSPGDAAVERRRAENVVSRLNGENAGVARFTTVRWETEFYKAHETFQTQIPPAVDCEIVVGILKWRLGTELPPNFEHAPDGEAYPSGTAYELLTAIEKRRAGGALPDVFVFRYTGGAPNIRLDDPARAQVERDWSNLRGFLERWFVSRQGHFLAALNSYGTEDDFEHQLESMLRRWLAEKVAGGRVVRWPPTKGSPFRGLNAFGARHAAVFFGRSAEVRRASDLWRDRAARGTPFLLVVGGSGAGKSSLARAGLVPRLTTPGVVPEVDGWRVAVMRPADSPQGPFLSLATALLQRESDLPPDEEGRGNALPEIAEGDYRTPADLAALLAHADASAVRAILNALTRIGERTKATEHFGREVRCDLVLLIDQLDELFNPSVAADVRSAFARLMSGLVASGRVWLVATLRADLYAPLLEIAELKVLKDGGASYDLAPPGSAELAEIVREPAAAAALTFDADPASGERLDERLLREADRPDMLPLVQLALSRLWEARETKGAETLLPFSAYEKLGGLKGIVAEAGEVALARLGDGVRARLPQLIRQMAIHRRGGPADAMNVRAVPLPEAAPDATSKALVESLVAARLLTLSDDGGGATSVRLAHQRVLTDWPRAAAIVNESADFYRVRGEVEDQRLRWEAGKRRGELLLSRGLPLAEARNMATRYAAEIGPETRAFIAASRRRANRAQTIGWTAAALFGLVAIGAGGAAKVALDEKRVAQKNFEVAQGAINGLLFNVTEGLQDVSGLQLESVRKILETSRKAIDDLLVASPDNYGLLRSQMAMLRNFSRIYLSVGGLRDARLTANQAVEIARRLQNRSQDAVSTRDLSVTLDTLGAVALGASDPATALRSYDESLRLTRQLVAAEPSSKARREDLATGLRNVGKVEVLTKEKAAALAHFQEGLAIDRKLLEADADDATAARGVMASLHYIGDLKVERGDLAGAKADFNESLAISRRLSAGDPTNKAYLRDVSQSLTKVGDISFWTGDPASALRAFQESLAIARRQLSTDPNDIEVQKNVAVGLIEVASAKRELGDRDGALAAARESLGLLHQIAAKDTLNIEAQHDLITGLGNIGLLKSQLADRAGALSAYQEALDVARKLAARDDPQAQQETARLLEIIGDLKSEAGDPAGAVRAYSESLTLRRAIAAPAAPETVRRELVQLLGKLGAAEAATGDRATAGKTLAEGRELARQLPQSAPKDPESYRTLWLILLKIVELDLQTGKTAKAFASLEEAREAAQKLVALDAKNGASKRTLQAILRTIGQLALQTGDQKKAAVSFRDALDVTRQITFSNPDAEKNLRDLLIDASQLTRLEDQLGNKAEAHKRAEETLAIVRKLTKRSDTVKSKTLLVTTLWIAGRLRKDNADLPGALAAFREALEIQRATVSAQTDDASKRFFASLLMEAGYTEVLAKDYPTALSLSEEAIKVAPGVIVNEAVRAYALMMLGRVDEARAMFLQHRGEMSLPHVTWEQGIRDDFADMRKAGVASPLMAEIEADFGKAAPAKAGQ